MRCATLTWVSVTTSLTWVSFHPRGPDGLSWWVQPSSVAVWLCSDLARCQVAIAVSPRGGDKVFVCDMTNFQVTVKVWSALI